MRLSQRLYISLTKILPKAYISYVEELMRFSGLDDNVLVYLGSSLALSIMLGSIVLVYGYYYTDISYALIAVAVIAAFMFVQLISYLLIYFRMERRAEMVEANLPDQLQLMSNNIKSGMTPFEALKLSARKEFGPLSEEITHTANKAYGVHSFIDALLDIKNRIKSVMLERVLKLEAASLRTGGNLSSLLSEISNDIRETQALRSDLLAKTKTYTAFILFTVIFGTPLLLAISIHFVEMLSGFSSMTGDVSAAQATFDIGLFGGGATLSPDFLIKLSYGMLAVTTLLSSMLMGVINKGKATSGIRYYPALAIVVLVMFTAFRYLIGSFFGSMM